MEASLRTEEKLILSRPSRILVSPVYSGGYRRSRITGHDLDCEPTVLDRDRHGAVYSAAETNLGFEAFIFAADSMKSEMRGTISDLKREPLNTP